MRKTIAVSGRCAKQWSGTAANEVLRGRHRVTGGLHRAPNHICEAGDGGVGEKANGGRDLRATNVQPSMG